MIRDFVNKLLTEGVDARNITVISLYDAQKNLIADSIPPVSRQNKNFK